MSTSITAAPARTSFGRFPLALAAMALLVVAPLVVAIVGLNSAKAVAPATSAAKGAPPAVKYLLDPRIGAPAIDYGQNVSNVPFYDHGWSKINEPGQSVSNVPFYDHGWSQAGTSTTPKAAGYFGPYYYNGYDSYTPSTATGYPPFGASYGTSVNHGYPLSGASYFGSSSAGQPQYVAPRPRNQ